MGSEKLNVPQRRFKEFENTGAWEQRKLGEIYKFQYGIFNNNPSNGGKYPVYGANGIIGGYTEFNSEDAIIIGHMGEYAGNVLWGDGKHFVTYNGIITAPRDNSVNSRFGYYLLQQKNIRQICGGSGQPFLSYEMLNKLQSCISANLDEQLQIEKFFTNFDNLITLHQRKLDKIQSMKKSYLSEMFPAEGETKPKRRFSGFTDDWEQRKLEDIVIWSKGSSLAKAVINDKSIGEGVIHYADLYKFSPVVNEVIHWSDSGEGTVIPNNSLLFPMSDVTPVGLARTSTITKTGVKAGGDTLIGTVAKHSSAEFVSYQINANARNILPLVTGTTVRHISSGSLDTLDILIPEIEEQHRIATLMNKMESLITLHQRKLEKLKNMKQAYLTEMFV